MTSYKNELERFIYEKCYDKIYKSLSKWVSENPNLLKLRFSKIKNPDKALLSGMLLKFTKDVEITEDTVNFIAVVNCGLDIVLPSTLSAPFFQIFIQIK